MVQEHDYLEQLPHAALEIRDGTVTAMNTAAHARLPQVVLGSPVPESLAQSLDQGGTAGSFAQGEDTFLFTRVPGRQGELILFRPAQGCAVTGRQLEGFSRQMRQQLGGMLNQMELMAGGDGSAPRLTQFSHSFHQMLRLVSNLEFLNIPEEEAQALFHPVTMDLAGLCIQLVRQAAPMLRKAGVALSYDSACTGLLVPGDPGLLQRMLLGLVSNAAKAARGGQVSLALRQWQGRAVVTVSDSGGGVDRDLAVLTQGEDQIPAPDQGAGMGLDVVRRIVALHGGTLLVRQGSGGGFLFTVSLPTGPLPAGLPLSSPSVEPDGGLSPFLVELADVLPAELFQPDED